MALGAVAGGIIGKTSFDLVKQITANDYIVGLIQNAFMVLFTSGALIYMLYKSHIRTLYMMNPGLCMVIGLLLGSFSAFLGIGGGPINLIVLYFFFSMDTKTAALNSIYIILFSQTSSFIHVLIQKNAPSFGWPVMIAMVNGGILGGIAGRGLSRKMTAKQVEIIFHIILVSIIGISTYNFAGFLSMT